MPWCDPCAKYYTPNSVNKDGSCPGCGTVLATRGSLRMEARSLGLPGPGQTEADVVEQPRTPWHFKLLVLAATIYLLWRLIEGILWMIDRA